MYLFFVFLICLLVETNYGFGSNPKYSRDDFPHMPHFVFGSGPFLPFKVEGVAAEDGRTPSIWDTAAHSGKSSRDNGDIACDQYHKYKEDVQLMVNTGLEAYRFSISWSRLIPSGRGHVNPKGLQYYNNLIDELIAHGVFKRDFANLRVSGYDVGVVPPKHCSAPFGVDYTRGNSTSEPYIANKQHGFIGLNIFDYWFEPATNKTEDVMATQRANDFYIGWFIDPLVFGDYPETLKRNAGTRIPSFTLDESNEVKSSFDFIGLNHYLTVLIEDDPDGLNSNQRDPMRDMGVKLIIRWDGAPEGEFPVSYSSGMKRSLEYFKHKYGNPPIYIHENGQKMPSNSSLNDTSRVEYLDAYIGSLLDAVRNGSNTWGYFTWSFMDLYELLGGYESGYGLYFVDMQDPELKRYPKLSAYWYFNFLKRGNMNKHVTNEALRLHTSWQTSHRFD
ncbi:hypothetical protein ACHQM5_026626 [Ranunculus cassubicifolius]